MTTYRSDDAFNPAEIWLARARLKHLILRTPLLFSPALSRRTGAQIYLKMECWQVCGCFKVRGAINMVAALSPEERDRGLVTASSGNHGIALAYAASLFGHPPTTIFLPEYADKTKLGKLEALGARIVLHGADFLQAFDRANAYAAESGATFVHSHAHPLVIGGQGTIGLEILEDLPDPDLVLVPIGGGGIISGVSTAVKAANPRVRVVGVQSSASPGAYLSLRDGVCHERVNLRPSIADGLLGTFSPLPFAITQDRVEGVALVEDDEIVAGMRALQTDEQLMVEPAAAVTLAAILAGKIDVQGLRVVLVITSRNVDAERYRRLIEHDPGEVMST
jgi:threonine dehydratase